MHGFTLWSSVTTYCAWMPQKSRIPCFYLFTNLQSEKYFTWRSILSSKHCAWSSIINNNMYSSFILYITIYFLTWLDERRVLQLVIYNRGTSVNFLPFYIKLESFNMFHAFTEPPLPLFEPSTSIPNPQMNLSSLSLLMTLYSRKSPMRFTKIQRFSTLYRPWGFEKFRE